MKKIFVILFIAILTFVGCSSEGENTLTLKNLAAGAIYLNFRGQLTTVPAGQTVVLSKLPKGSYDFATTYSIPAGISKSTAVGDLTGEFGFKAGTKILVLYSSNLSEDTYTIYATKTSSDNLDDQGNPLFP